MISFSVLKEMTRVLFLLQHADFDHLQRGWIGLRRELDRAESDRDGHQPMSSLVWGKALPKLIMLSACSACMTWW